MTTVALATCLQKPHLQPSDELFARALAARGVRAEAHPWNGPFEPFAQADAVVVRSTWDYVPAVDDFARWLERLETQASRVFNAPRLMLWNLRKTYLLDLAAKGAPLPPTLVVDGDASALRDAMARLAAEEAVVKPVVGGGAAGISTVRLDDPRSFERAAAHVGGTALVQPLIAEVKTVGETSLIYFAGEFSHAVVKRPPAGSIFVQEERGGSTRPAQPSAETIDAGWRVLGLLPGKPLYARIDVVLGDARLDGSLALMEVEVIEPELFLSHDEGAAGRFANALLRAIGE